MQDTTFDHCLEYWKKSRYLFYKNLFDNEMVIFGSFLRGAAPNIAAAVVVVAAAAADRCQVCRLEGGGGEGGVPTLQCTINVKSYAKMQLFNYVWVTLKVSYIKNHC